MTPEFPIPIAVQEYIATIRQTGINHPQTRELKNTIGTITCTRSGQGYYTLTKTGAFPENKTYIPNANSNLNWAMMSTEDYSIQLYINSPDSIIIQFWDNTYTNKDISEIMGDDKELFLPEIKVFNNQNQ